MSAPFNPPTGLLFPQQSLVANPVPFTSPPKEGPKSVTAAIQWNTDASQPPDQSVKFDLGNLKQQTLFTQIVGFYVDNKDCGSDITFYLPDTQSTFTVPAQTAGYYPALTNDVIFIVKHLNTSFGVDVTRIEVLNSFFPASFQPVFQRVNIGNNNAAPVPVSLVNAATATAVTLNGNTLVVAGAASPNVPVNIAASGINVPITEPDRKVTSILHGAIGVSSGTAVVHIYNGAAKTLVGLRGIVSSLWNAAAQSEITCSVSVNGFVIGEIYFDLGANERFSSSFGELPIPQSNFEIPNVTTIDMNTVLGIGGFNDGTFRVTALLV